MDLSTATWAEIALAGLSLLTVAVALVTIRRHRATRVESGTLTDLHAKTIARVRLLEFRTSELTSHVAQLERWRESVGAAPDISELRAVLTGGRQGVEPSVLRLPNAES